ncbi:SRPBCC family protein [Amycolatopsis suaedae]|uniref:SRPBCC family protein n=1 Tax=Amycolatopsis suaedae TaxID=2510978 RepID=A0A4V2EM56_9PSEU|nr:SRPBCC family protein [Amycolatopsis suaedae]RZQ63895.1 SRPBCC family protein [Amycolatopsis suaedae]
MVDVSRIVRVSPDAVFEVLADGWTYSSWVVGNSHVRDVDPGWPKPGTRIHHSVGVWPAQIEDVTVVHDVQPGRLLELDARVWPLGSARVRLELTPVAAGTRVTMSEEALGGPLAALPHALQAVLLRPRNTEALARLADLAEGRHAERGTPGAERVDRLRE